MEKLKLIRHGDRIGLYMIVATLAAIVAIAAILKSNSEQSSERTARNEAMSLARILARIPHDQLVAQHEFLEIARESWHGNFAYATVLDADGEIAAEVMAPGVDVHRMVLPSQPEPRFTEREFDLAGTPIVEVRAPLLEGGEIEGYLRLGFRQRATGWSAEQLPFVASLAFPVFLLTPVFYWLVRREVSPLRDANDELSGLIQQGRMGEVTLAADGELGEFMGNFNAFVRLANERMAALEQEQTTLATRAQLLTYRKSRMETVLDSIPEAVFIIDQTGTISYANQRVETLLGVSRQRIIEQDPSAWCTDEAILDVLARYTSRHSTRQYLAQTVIIEPQKERAKNLSIKAYPLFSPSNPNDAQGTLIVIRDTSREIQSQRTQSEFVTHVAHELKTPLHTIGLAGERLLYDDELTDAERIDAANIVNDEVDRMSSLINDLLSLTKIEMGELPIERGHLKLREFLEDVFESVTRSGANKELSFELALPNDFSPVYLDKDLLRIAVNNLLTNAIKYSDAGGKVTLRADDSEEHVRIAVTDAGIGISAEDQEKIFSKFFRSEDGDVRSRSGHGLGLSLTQQIVELHGGSLSVESSVGQGSTFTIELRKEAGLLRQAV